jgi:hypothetical protein
MATERRYYHTINISDLPEVVRLTEEAKRAKRPIKLTIDDQEAGVLVPPKGQPTSGKSRMGPRRAHTDESQLLAGFGAVTPRNRPENWAAVREEVEQALARDVVSRS